MSDQPTAEDRFRGAQARLLVATGVRATARLIRAEGAWAHVVEAGSGRPLVLIHDAGAVAAGWAPLMADLQGPFHVIAPDWPGSGLTERALGGRAPLREQAASYLLAVLDALDLGRVNLAGTSMGGYWALAFALAHPERVQRMALLGAPAGSARRPALRDRFLTVPGLGGAVHSLGWPGSRSGVRASLRRRVAHPERLPDELLDVLRAGARLRGAERTDLRLARARAPLLGRSRLTYALRDELAQLRLPVLLLWGERDPCPARWAEELCRLLPDARLEVVPEAGHLLWLDEPAATAALLRDFIDGSAQLEVHQGLS